MDVKVLDKKENKKILSVNLSPLAKQLFIDK